MIQNNTPIEKYDGVFVKREDLACLSPGPPFAKVRGLYKHMLSLKERGVQTVGYTETSISMAGWGVAWVAKELGMKAVIFDPIYKGPQPVLEYHRTKWDEFGAEIVKINAGMAKVNYNISRGKLKDYPASEMLPLGLPFPETISEVAKEYIRTVSGKNVWKTVVMCIGSGTMAAGVLRGSMLTNKALIFGILCRPSKRIWEKKAKISAGAGYPIVGNDYLEVIDLGYEYTQEEQFSAPFPCNPYYDRKAWKWCSENQHRLERQILFWNIGA